MMNPHNWIKSYLVFCICTSEYAIVSNNSHNNGTIKWEAKGVASL